MDTLSEQIADFIVGAKFEDLPPEVIRKAKEEIVFLFGRAFEGVFTDQGQQLRSIARQISVSGRRRATDGMILR